MVTIKGSTGGSKSPAIRVVHVDKPGTKKGGKPLTTGQALSKAMQQIGEEKQKAVTPNVTSLVLLTDRLQTLNLDIAAQSAALQRNDLYSESRSLLNIAIRMAADLEHMLLILGQERAGIIDDVLEMASIELVSSYNNDDADDDEEDDLDEDEDDFEDDTDHNDDEDDDEDSDGLDDDEAEATARANAAEFGVSLTPTQNPESAQDPNADADEDDSDDGDDSDDEDAEDN